MQRQSFLPSSIILFVAILIFEFVPPEIYSFIVIALLSFLVLTTRSSYLFFWQNPVVPLLLVFVVGLAFALTNPLDGMLKDLWYILKPVSIICLGMLFALTLKSTAGWIKVSAFAIIIVSIVNIYLTLTSGDATGDSPEIQTRAISFLAAFLAPFVYRFYPSSSPRGTLIKFLAVTLVGALIFLSESRAALLTFGIGWLAAYGTLQKSSRSLIVFGLIIFAIVVFFPMLPQYDFQGQRYLAKMQNSINEVMFEAGTSRIDMYRNWRGFEAYRAYTMWADAPFLKQLFGFGHGSEIQLGKLVTFNEEDVDSLHSIHNSYFGLLVKTGLFGLAAFLMFMIRPLMQNTGQQDDSLELYSRLIRGGAVALLLTSALISGPLNKTNLDALLFIWSIAYGVVLYKQRSLLPRKAVSQDRGERRLTGLASAQ